MGNCRGRTGEGRLETAIEGLVKKVGNCRGKIGEDGVLQQASCATRQGLQSSGPHAEGQTTTKPNGALAYQALQALQHLDIVWHLLLFKLLPSTCATLFLLDMPFTKHMITIFTEARCHSLSTRACILTIGLCISQLADLHLEQAKWLM